MLEAERLDCWRATRWQDVIGKARDGLFGARKQQVIDRLLARAAFQPLTSEEKQELQTLLQSQGVPAV